MVKDQSYIKKMNMDDVVEILVQHQPISRIEISKKAESSKTSITRTVNLLLEKQMVAETDIHSKGVGRQIGRASCRERV